MSKKITFTPAAIEALREGPLLDRRTPGLLIEVSAKGHRMWRYRRRIVGRGEALKRTLGLFPKFSIADARAWAEDINAQIEGGFDPRELKAEAAARQRFTVDFCHRLYMEAVRVNQHRTKRTASMKRLRSA